MVEEITGTEGVEVKIHFSLEKQISYLSRELFPH
jgi:hypothetical protein